jgi:hypothetical protein
MTMLREINLGHLRNDAYAAVHEAGGLWRPAPGVPIELAIAEAAARGLRALSLGEYPPLVAERLPSLEYLFAGTVRGEFLEQLPNLRGVSVASIDGPFDGRRLTRLAWLFIEEPGPHGLDGLLDGHPTLRELSIDKHPYPDLRPLAKLVLDALSVHGGRMQSLDGLDAFAGRLLRLRTGSPRLTSLREVETVHDTLRKLSVESCPQLASLHGIETLTQLEVLELGSLRQITRIDVVRHLLRLRLLATSELKGVETLAPIANHPSLEFLDLGRTKDGDLDPVATLPNLRLITAPSKGWNRDITAFPYLHNYRPEDEPAIEDYRRLMHA